MNFISRLQVRIKIFLANRQEAKNLRIRNRSWDETMTQLNQGTVTVKQIRAQYAGATDPKGKGALCAASRYEAFLDHKSWVHL